MPEISQEERTRQNRQRYIDRIKREKLISKPQKKPKVKLIIQTQLERNIQFFKHLKNL